MQVGTRRPSQLSNDGLQAVLEIAAEIAGPAAADVDRRARFPSEAMAALREARLLGAYVPMEIGGLGCSVPDLVAMCQALGRHCAATALIFAMHHIQVACIVRHGLSSAFFRDYLAELAEQQLLLASATSEVGVGGDLSTSITAVEREGETYRLDKEALTISYGEQADGILVTARRAPDAVASDQLLVLLRRGDYVLTQTSDWDTLGMRGTCSPGFRLASLCTQEQALPAPFADIASHTMVPMSHILWSACWLGIASDAVGRARGFVRAETRRRPGASPVGALRLGEVSAMLQTMRTNVGEAASTYQQVSLAPIETQESLSSLGSAVSINNLKIASSQLVVEIVSRAMAICGMSGYRTESPFSLGRHLRDAYSAGLMIGNDRLLTTNATLLLALKDV